VPPGARSSKEAQPQHAGAALLEAVAVMDRLRSPGGCPWDADQTHASLAPYAIEEAHELAEAAESGTTADLREELGDLLLQVLFHARIAAEGPDGFDIDDVARTLVDKLTYRHPHVFAADGEPSPSAEQVTENWEVLKAAEQQRTSALDGIPVSLPALARAQKVLRRLARAGIGLDDMQAGVEGNARRSDAGPEDEEAGAEEEVGAKLLDLVREAEALGIDAEAALRAHVRRLEQESRAVEQARSGQDAGTVNHGGQPRTGGNDD